MHATAPASPRSTSSRPWRFTKTVIGTLAILAPGLLGASVARAARARAAANRIVIWARRPEVRLAIAREPWCDLVAATPAEAVAEADLVVLAPPVTRIAELAARIAAHLLPSALVTDVGSTKAEVCRAASDALRGGTFVGSHPMAGSEKSGWEHGTANLFDGRTCFVTPLRETPPAPIATVVGFWDALGAKVVTADPDEHDEIVAHISHLPQVLASTLGGLLAGKPAKWSQLAGNGLRDTTRIAAGDPTMWLDILEHNREEILRAIRAYHHELHHLESAIANRDWAEVRAKLERGRHWRTGLNP